MAQLDIVYFGKEFKLESSFSKPRRLQVVREWIQSKIRILKSTSCENCYAGRRKLETFRREFERFTT